MSAAVDVLAVMRRMSQQARVCRAGGAGSGTQNGEDEAAIADVAELIEAAREKQRVTGGGNVVTVTESLAAYHRLDAAIARVGGAA